MDNIRILLWLALLTMIWFAYGAWVNDYGQRTPEPAQTETPAETPGAETPQTETLPEIGNEPTQTAVTAPAQSPATEPKRPIHIVTDVFDAIIDLDGGDLVRVDLPEYPVDKDNPSVVVRMLDYAPATRWSLQTGLLTEAAGDEEPNHLAAFSSAQTSYELQPGADELRVDLVWKGGDNLTAHKIYTFTRGFYDIKLDVEIDNGSTKVWSGAAYTRMVRRHVPVKRTFRDIETYSTKGPVLYDAADGYQKLSVDDLAATPIDETVSDAWYAGIEHHFVAAVVPPMDDPFTFEASMEGDRYLLTAIDDVVNVPPGEMHTFPVQLFIGPKLQDQLTKVHPELDRAVDYGKLTFLAHPLFLLLKFVHKYVGNWGWSIVIVTFLIKLAFYKLTATSGRSMAKMRKLGPRMKALQERYKDDRQALSQAMMELYKKEKVNPAAGCLPILIQMPFLYAFYWMLIETVEMRQAPFMLWVDDLSKRDPYFIMPLIMGAAMFFQSRLNPAPPDPVQARIMQIMPLAFAAFMSFFPSGLVIYWLTNTLLSILQQWRINKLVAAESAKAN